MKLVLLLIGISLSAFGQVNALRGRSSIAGNVGVSVGTLSPLPAGSLGIPYSQTLTATGGVAPYTWTITAGTICAGLGLSSGGVISGTPTTLQTCSFDVTATDSLSVSGSKPLSLTILLAAGGSSMGGNAKAGGNGKGH